VWTGGNRGGSHPKELDPDPLPCRGSPRAHALGAFSGDASRAGRVRLGLQAATPAARVPARGGSGGGHRRSGRRDLFKHRRSERKSKLQSVTSGIVSCKFPLGKPWEKVPDRAPRREATLRNLDEETLQMLVNWPGSRAEGRKGQTFAHRGSSSTRISSTLRGARRR